MDWFQRDFDHPFYFDIYEDKDLDADQEGRGLARLLELEAGSLVLDLPCGWGRLRPALEAAGLKAVGGDLSPMNLARHRREQAGPVVRLDLRALPFRSGIADGVFCAFTSWGYFRTDQENLRQLQEFARVLRPGGTLLLDLAGRDFLLKALQARGRGWFEVEGRYRERVRLSPDGRRFLTDRHMGGMRFQHDVWIPTDTEARECLASAGFQVDQVFASVEGAPWTPHGERSIYRALRV